MVLVINEYINWEIQMNQIFAKCRIYDRRKIKIVISVLMNDALTWWNNLHNDDKPYIWDDMKLVMREQFITSYHTSFSSVPNMLLDSVQILSSKMIKEEQSQRHDLFQTMFVVTDRHCRVIIDSDTCANLVSSELVEKLCLTTEPHLHPYYIQSSTPSGRLNVNKKN